MTYKAKTITGAQARVFAPERLPPRDATGATAHPEPESPCAAPQRMTVSRRALRDALEHADAYAHGNSVPAYTIGSIMAALRALNIDVTE